MRHPNEYSASMVHPGFAIFFSLHPSLEYLQSAILSHLMGKIIYSRTAVPNLSGTRDRFHGRQFFHGWVVGGRGDGSGGNESNGEWQMKLRSLAHHSPPAMQPRS